MYLEPIQISKTELFVKIVNSLMPLAILKLVSAIFYQIFIFLPNDGPSKTVKSAFYFI